MMIYNKTLHVLILFGHALSVKDSATCINSIIFKKSLDHPINNVQPKSHSSAVN